MKGYDQERALGPTLILEKLSSTGLKTYAEVACFDSSNTGFECHCLSGAAAVGN